MIWSVVSTALSVISAVKTLSDWGSSRSSEPDGSVASPVSRRPVTLRQQMASALQQEGVPTGQQNEACLDGLMNALLQASAESGTGLPLVARLQGLASRLARDEHSAGLDALHQQVEQLRQAQGASGMAPLNLGRLVSRLAQGATTGSASLGLGGQA